jgi:putative Mg2+ transporter-C (MgtC) family protein
VSVTLADKRMLSLHEIFLRLAFAALLGALIGIERDYHRRPAGIRTSLFVCLGSALFTVLSGEIAHRLGDTSGTRIASNLVQGIGFLGAGAILRESGTLVGMTTAATIFVEAAIGMAAGGGLYYVAGYSTGIVLFGLIVLAWITTWINLKPRMVAVRVTASHAESITSEVQRMLADMDARPQHFRQSMSGDTTIVEFDGDFRHRQEEKIMQKLNRAGVFVEVTPLVGHHE